MEKMEDAMRPEDDPAALKMYLNERIKSEAEKLLVRDKGEELNPASFTIIANQVEKKSGELGMKLTRETIDSLIASPEVQDAILHSTIVRLDTETMKSEPQLMDSRGDVIKLIKDPEDLKNTVEEERQNQQ